MKQLRGIDIIPEKPELDWNDMSDLGLLYAINTIVLHPIGLAIARDPETGQSTIIKADDGYFVYDKDSLERNIKKLEDNGFSHLIRHLV